MEVSFQTFDVERTASVYADSAGSRWWTKSWFNGREKGERSIEIPRTLAIKFIRNEIGMDEWLSRFYPKQMSVYHQAVAQTRQQLLGM